MRTVDRRAVFMHQAVGAVPVLEGEETGAIHGENQAAQ